MSGPSSPHGPWFDSQRQRWYRYDQSTDELVYDDGQRRPRSAIPRHLPPNQLPPAISPPSNASFSSPTRQTAYAAYPAAPAPDPLIAPFNQLSLSNQSTFGFRPGIYDQNGIRMVASEDSNAQIRTVVGTGPADRITDTQLYASGVKASRMLFGSPGEIEPLFSNFRLQKRTFFTVGRVFHVLWAEPAGETSTLITTFEAADRINAGITKGRHDERVYSKVRRFVVVRTGEQYCSALPVMSYGRRGVGKPGVTKSEHAIIHTGSEPPDPHKDELPNRGELPMRDKAIRVVPDTPGDKLDPMSRIDFGRVHTVQHNIKAKSFGMVHKHSLNPLISQFGNVWLNSMNPPQLPSQAESSSQAAARALPAPSRSSGSNPPRSVASAGSGTRASKSRTAPVTASNVRRIQFEDRRAPPAADEDEEEDDGEEDEDDEDQDEDDDEDEDEDEDDDDNSEDIETRVSQNTTAARQALQALNQLRRQGYSMDQAFAVVMAKLQTDRGLTREQAQRLLSGWVRTASSWGVSS